MRLARRAYGPTGTNRNGASLCTKLPGIPVLAAGS